MGAKLIIGRKVGAAPWNRVPIHDSEKPEPKKYLEQISKFKIQESGKGQISKRKKGSKNEFSKYR